MRANNKSPVIGLPFTSQVELGACWSLIWVSLQEVGNPQRTRPDYSLTDAHSFGPSKFAKIHLNTGA